jgi:hypothetical protein
MKTRNDVLDFHGRELAFLPAPENVTVELPDWH